MKHPVLAPTGRLTRFFEHIFLMIWLNVLILVASLPLVTLGPAMLAAIMTVESCLREPRTAITRTFRHHFRQNLGLGIGLEVVGVALLGDLLVSGITLLRLPQPWRVLLLGALGLSTLILVSLLIAAVVYHCRYTGGWRLILYHARLIFAHHWLACLTLVAVNAWPLGLIIAGGSAGLLSVVYLFTFIGFGLTAWLNGRLFWHIHTRLETPAAPYFSKEE
ncbi:YesL family protein [Lacticaseibacillus mingshuiensis]|uniref:YesL family protein n=1 Tax=Lacticaseibacillus mingshuiensis TaxID=2799574 RepID=UPI0019527A36|nr:YesL family protein [Lacticaseibacillus mingshuiensis]